MSENHHSKVISSLTVLLALLIAGIVGLASYFVYQSNSFSREQIRLEREIANLKSQIDETQELEPEIIYLTEKNGWTIAQNTENQNNTSTLLRTAYNSSRSSISCVDLRLIDAENELVSPTDFNGQDLILRQALLKFIDEEQIPLFTSKVKNSLRRNSQDLFLLDELCSNENYLFLITQDINDEEIIVLWKISSNEEQVSLNFDFFNPVNLSEIKVFQFQDQLFLGGKKSENITEFYLIDHSALSLDLVESCQQESDSRLCRRELILSEDE